MNSTTEVTRRNGRGAAGSTRSGERRGLFSVRPRLPLARGHLIALCLITAATATGYLAFELWRFNTLQDGSDLLYFDQAVRSYAHFHAGVSAFFGRFWGYPGGISVLSDHFAPIIASLAPLYWIYNGPQTLLVAQAVLLALAVPPLWVFTRRAAGGGPYATVAAYGVTVAYALSWPIAEAVSFDFHEVAFAPVLMAVAFERLQAGRTRAALLALGALLLVKEDMGFFAAGVGLYLALSRPRLIGRQRLVGLGLIVAGVGWTLLATRIFIPAFGGTANKYWAYPTLGATIPQAVLHLIAHPLSSLRMLAVPGLKVSTVGWLLGALCFLPLLSPISLAALPLLAERMLATTHSIWWGTGSHYNAYVIVPLLCGAVDGAVRLDRWIRIGVARLRARRDRSAAGAVTLTLTCAMCVTALAMFPRFSFGQALMPGTFRPQPGTIAEATAISKVPPGVTVETIPSVGPTLSSRDTVWFWNYAGPLWAPWVVAQVDSPQFTWPSVAAQRQRVATLERAGYRVVYDNLGFVVLHQVRAASLSAASLSAASLRAANLSCERLGEDIQLTGRANTRRHLVVISPNVIAVGLITVVVAAAYLLSELKRFSAFQENSDLVYFYRAVRSYAHFHPGISILYGRFTGHAGGASILGDHFSPIVAVLAPLIWISDRPQTLLFAQAALFALAIPPLWVFTRRAIGRRYGTVAAYVVAVVYALSWPVASAVAFSFHEAAFAPVLMAVILERLQAGRARGALIALGALLAVKEDMGLFAAGLGMYLLAARPTLISRQRLTGLCLIAGGLAYTWIATRLLIPAFGGDPNKYWGYPTFGATIPRAILHVLVHPISSLQVLITPGVKVTTVGWLFGAFCFLSLLSPITIAALPLLAERMFGTTHSDWWGTGLHYNAFVVVVLLCGAVDGAARLDRWLWPVLGKVARRARPARTGSPGSRPGAVALACVCVVCAVTLWLVQYFSFSDLLKPAFYASKPTPAARALAGAIAWVPPGVTVEAIPNADSSLAARDTVLFWSGYAPAWAPWVIAQVSMVQYTWPSVAAERGRVALLERDGYRLVYRDDGVLVLHRP